MPASAFDLYGRIVLEDAFSAILNRLQQKARDAGDELDDAFDPDVTTARQRMRQIERELNRLKAKARQTELTVGEVERMRTLGAELKRIRGGLDEVGTAAFSALSGMRGLAAVTLSLAGSFSLLQIGRVVVDLTALGAQSRVVARAYENLADSVGIASDQLLGDLRRAARGAAMQAELMVTANRAMLASGHFLASRLPQLFEIARAASLATGEDIGYVFKTLIKGIVKASPLLIDNADIYIKIGDAVERWAERQGKTVDQLTLLEQRMAIANAVIQQGTRFITQLGLASETSADKMQSLPVAIEDLRSSIGELLVVAQVPRVVGEAADRLEASATTMRYMADIVEELGERFSGIGIPREVVESVKALNDWLDRIEVPEGIVKTADVLDDLSRGVLGLLVPIVNLTTGQRLLGDAAKAAAEWLDKEAEATDSWVEQVRRGSGWVAEQVQAYQERQRLLQEFNSALAETRRQAIGVDALNKQLADLAARIDVLASGVPALPDIGTSLLAFDPQAVRQYLAELARVRPELQAIIDEALEHVDAAERAQQAMAQYALSIRDDGEALQYLARSLLGPKAGVVDLVKRFDELPPAVQAAIRVLGGFSAALDEIERKSGRPITLDVRVQGFERSVADVERLATRLAQVTDLDTARRFYQRYTTEYRRFWQSLGDMTEWEAQALERIMTGRLEKIIGALEQANRQQERLMQEHARGMFRSASELRSAIEGALRVGVDVTREDVLAAMAGTYEDKALEAARRLNAIAERGFAELKAHPDWAAALKIPPEVLSGSEEQLKAWAAQTSKDVQDLARPDLIDWDAFLENFRRLQERAAARELTIDIAVEKLKAAGMLEGSEEQVRKRVAEALGIAEPTMTIEALFETTPTAREELLAQLLQGQDALPVPVSLQPAGQPALVTPEGARLEAGVPAEAAAPMQLAPPQITVAGGGDLSDVGADAATLMISSFEMTVGQADVAGKTLAIWRDGFQAHLEEFGQIGSRIGDVFGDAFVEAVEEAVGDVRRTLAHLLAPEVAGILQQRAAGRSALP